MPYLPVIDKEEIRRLHASGAGVDNMMRQLGPGIGRKRVIEMLEELGLPRYGKGQRSPETGRRRAVHLDPATGLKKCSKCKEDKPGDAFWRSKATYDGLSTQCRECRKVRVNAYRRNNYDKYVAARNSWHDANIERIMLLNARRRAKRKNLPITITVEDIRIPENCPVSSCGRLLIPSERRKPGEKGRNSPSSPSLDMWNPALGYIPGNVWVICLYCNSRKQNMTGEQHVAFGKELIKAFHEKSLHSLAISGIDLWHSAPALCVMLFSRLSPLSINTSGSSPKKGMST